MYGTYLDSEGDVSDINKRCGMGRNEDEKHKRVLLANAQAQQWKKPAGSPTTDGKIVAGSIDQYTYERFKMADSGTK